jgi:hypothetical protein
MHEDQHLCELKQDARDLRRAIRHVPPFAKAANDLQQLNVLARDLSESAPSTP